MKLSRSLFSAEEATLERAQAFLNDKAHQKNILLPEFRHLYKNYQKIYKQLRRLIAMSDRQQLRLSEVNEQLELANHFIRKTFGLYLSDAIVETILESPEGMALGGEERRVTVLMADLRGFTSICERLLAEDVVRMLNIFLEAMTEVILKYKGTIDEFIGDAILAVFGVPVQRDDDPQRAVACAVEMQLALEKVNAEFQKYGYPDVTMGIGINTGDVIAGNIGSSKRVKYGVVGSAVNLTGRIESYTIGGQVLISPSTREACGEILRIGNQIEILPKGVTEAMIIYDVRGIDGAFHIVLPENDSNALRHLDSPLKATLYILEQKHIHGEGCDAEVLELSRTGASVRTLRGYRALTDLKMTLFAADGSRVTDELYAKVLERSHECHSVFHLSFTYVPSEADAFLQQLSL